MGALVTLLADHLFERVVRVRTNFFRPSGGMLSFASTWAAFSLGVKVVLAAARGCCSLKMVLELERLVPPTLAAGDRAMTGDGPSPGCGFAPTP